MACFLSRTAHNNFSLCILPKSKGSRNFKIFYKNYELTPLRNNANFAQPRSRVFPLKGKNPGHEIEFCHFLKLMFLLSRMAHFLSRTAPNTFSLRIFPKKTESRNFKFLTKTTD